MRREDARHGPPLAGSDTLQSGSHFVTPLRLTPNDTAVAFAQPRFQAPVRLGLGERREILQQVDPRQPPFGFELLPQVCGRCSAPSFYQGSLARVLP
jgi:hypothetical protein